MCSTVDAFLVMLQTVFFFALSISPSICVLLTFAHTHTNTMRCHLRYCRCHHFTHTHTVWNGKRNRIRFDIFVKCEYGYGDMKCLWKSITHARHKSGESERERERETVDHICGGTIIPHPSSHTQHCPIVQHSDKLMNVDIKYAPWHYYYTFYFNVCIKFAHFSCNFHNFAAIGFFLLLFLLLFYKFVLVCACEWMCRAHVKWTHHIREEDQKKTETEIKWIKENNGIYANVLINTRLNNIESFVFFRSFTSLWHFFLSFELLILLRLLLCRSVMIVSFAIGCTFFIGLVQGKIIDFA